MLKVASWGNIKNFLQGVLVCHLCSDSFLEVKNWSGVFFFGFMVRG